ncbi:hypothetical protein BJY52DRAFT_1303798, partial [Lactarius psammicola]
MRRVTLSSPTWMPQILISRLIRIIVAPFVLPSCTLQRNLSIDVPVLDTYRPKSLLNQANAVAESHNWDAFRQSTSEHICLFSERLSTTLACARAYMPKVATYRICVSSGS